MKKKCMLLTILITMQLLTGCWDRVEVNDIAIVIAAAIDKTNNNEIRLTLQILLPTISTTETLGGGASKGKQVIQLSQQGRNIMSCYEKIQGKLPRNIIFSHIEGIIIGERLAQDGVSDILDFFSRYRHSNLRAYIIFTKNEASDILSVSAPMERSPMTEIKKELELDVGLKVRLKDFLNMLTEEGTEAIAAEVEKSPFEITKAYSSDTSARIYGAAIFNKDKLIGWMNDIETGGVLWLSNEVKTATLIGDISDEKGMGNISAIAQNAKTTIKPIFSKGHLQINVYVKTKALIYENTSGLDLSDTKKIKIAEDKLSLGLKNRLELSLRKMQKELKSDVAGFGAAVYRKYPKQWNNHFKENWNEEFPDLEVNITCQVTVARTGRDNKSIRNIKEEN